MQILGNASFLRRWVSGPRRRLTLPELGIDLDGAYIDDRFLALSYPATGVYALYRNPVGEVVRLLDSQHAGHYQVYNLCEFTPYPYTKFSGKVLSYPWTDHTPPTLRILVELSQSILEYLAEDEEHTVVVHCKAGKGRTGIVACAYLMTSGTSSGAQEAMRLYGEKRTMDGRGVTIRGQRRYLGYLEELLHHHNFSIPSILGDKRLTHPETFHLTSLSLTLPSSVPTSLVRSIGSRTQVSLERHLPGGREDGSPLGSKVVVWEGEINGRSFNVQGGDVCIRLHNPLYWCLWLHTSFLPSSGMVHFDPMEDVDVKGFSEVWTGHGEENRTNSTLDV
ncbi:MAG: protein-tyrosine phosphatase-like protein [Piptocephalis tieghemiana]|nr:MAG: protein-tyrosine phosphatase-like protein [Piptocephalis tieghemiana]